MSRTKSTPVTRLAMVVFAGLVVAMLLGATFPDFFHGLMDGLKG